MAAGDALLQQCDGKKLLKRIIVENLKIEDTVKIGWPNSRVAKRRTG